MVVVLILYWSHSGWITWLSEPAQPARFTGVTFPMTYFGMWRSFFGWHTEDADLMAVNFLHWGAPKMWCVILHWTGLAPGVAQDI